LKTNELRNMGTAMRELGAYYQEALGEMNVTAEDLALVKRLWKTGGESKLIKMGLALITFPEPTPLSETIGALVLSLGLIQKKRSQSILHIDDVYTAFQDVFEGLNVGTEK
jgi:hypothetical protein